MSTPQTQTLAGATTTVTKDPAQVLDEILDRSVEYVPFLSEQQIKLTPRMVLRFMCKPTKSGKKATLEQALHFCMLCKARGLNPWEGDAFIVGYDTNNGPEFSLITAHQAFLKRAEVHPEYDGMQSGVIVRRGTDVVEEEGDFFLEGDVLLGGWAKILFKNRATPTYKRLKLGTFDKGFGRWNTDPAGMIVKCAEADGLRSAFPNSLGGMYLEDEMPGKEESGRTSDDLSFTNGIRDAQAADLKAKTEAKAADLKERLAQRPANGEGGTEPRAGAETPATPKAGAKTRANKATKESTFGFDESAEKARLIPLVQEQFQARGFDEERIAMSCQGEQLEDLSLDTLVELHEMLKGGK